MGGGVLFGAIPCKQFQTVLSNSQFITLAKLRLNMEVIRGGGKCECCGKLLDNLGLHCLSCTRKGGGMWNRHEAICKAILGMCRLPEIPAKSEKRDLIRDSQERPADVLLLNGKDGKPEAIDVTVVHSCNNSSSSAALRNPEHVLNQAVKRKQEKYVEKSTAEGMLFTVFGLDVYGQLHGDAVHLLERFASYAAANLGEDYMGLLKRFKIQIQVALAKQVCQMIHVRG